VWLPEVMEMRIKERIVDVAALRILLEADAKRSRRNEFIWRLAIELIRLD
jgi:hypothetical protein